MPEQNSYPTLSSPDNTTYVTGFYMLDGVLTTVKIPASYVYGDKWTTGDGAPSGSGVGPGDMYLDVLTGNVYQWSGTAWSGVLATLISGIYDIPVWIEGKPLNSETVYTLVAPRGFTLPSGLPNTQLKAGTAATGSAVFTLNKNGSSIGTLTVNAGGTTASASFTASVSCAAGDVFSVVAPATADATLANIAMTFAGTRP
jgi:hypothetical protein